MPGTYGVAGAGPLGVGVPLAVGVGVTGTDGLADADDGLAAGVAVGDALGDGLDERAGVAGAVRDGVLAGAATGGRPGRKRAAVPPVLGLAAVAQPDRQRGPLRGPAARSPRSAPLARAIQCGDPHPPGGGREHR